METMTPAAQQGHKEVLDLAARGAPTVDILGALVRAARHLTEDGVRAAIFIIDPDGLRLRFAAASGMSREYTQAMDGFEVGPDKPSCGQAAVTGRAVIVRDVAKDPLWAPYRQLAQEHGIRACWSFPLHGHEGRYLGSFALYHEMPRKPDRQDYEQARYLANIAALVIERHKTAEEHAHAQEKARRELQEANRHKDVFLAMLGHELRNPLSALRMGLQVMQRAQHRPDMIDRGLASMERQVEQMTRLAEDLLDISRITQGKLDLRIMAMELQPAVTSAIEAVSHSCQHRQQHLHVQQPAKPIFIQADPARLTQMLTNLLNNACKFTDPGGNIWLTVEVQGPEVVMQVRDDGMGIAADQQQRIFDMFAQLPGQGKGTQRGLGMGLTLVKRLTAMHDGEVSVHSDGPGRGSEFTIRLPANPA